MNSRSLTILDSVTLPKPELVINARDFLADYAKAAGGKQVLVVGTNATYSGYFIQDSRVYPGQNMLAGVGTWCAKDHGGVASFNLPVLLNHDQKGEPLGRVLKATYHKLWTGPRWMEDWKNPAEGYDQGSGYTRLMLGITDADAQEKVIDQRYLTVSTNFRTSYMLCSICGDDLHKGCDHDIGEIYEVDDAQRKCMMVTGPQFNKECSFVNSPANPNATIDEVKWANEVKDALCDRDICDQEFEAKYKFESWLTSREAPVIGVMDAAGEVVMLTKDDEAKGGLPATKTQIHVPELPDNTPGKLIEDKEDPVEITDEEFALANIAKRLVKMGLLKTDTDDMSDIAMVSSGSLAYFTGLTEKSGDHMHSVFVSVDMVTKKARGYTENTYPTSKKAKLEYHTHSIDIDIDDLNFESVTGETRDADYGAPHTHGLDLVVNRDAEMVPSYEQVMDAITKLERVSEEDAKLSAAQRKMLASKDYCGPSKTFPVPDEDHVKAARLLVARFKGPDNQKNRILSSVARKAKQLGVGSADADKYLEEETHPMSDPKNPDGKPAELTEDQKTIQTLRDALEKEQTRTSDLQSQLDSQKADNKDLTEKLTDALADAHAQRCDHLAMLRGINCRDIEGHDLKTAEGQKKYVAELKKRTAESIVDSITDELPFAVKKLPNLEATSDIVNDEKPGAKDGATTRKTDDGAPKPKPETKGKDLV